MGGHDRLALTLTLGHGYPTPNPNPNPNQVATIVALAIDGGEPTMDGLVRLLDRAGLIRKAPLVEGSRVLGCFDEEFWEEGDIAEVLEVRTAEQEASFYGEPSDVPKGPSRGGDRTNREKGKKKFRPYTRYSP